MTGLLSPAHIVVLLIVLLLVFGAKRLPELGRSLGSGMREFKHSIGGYATEQPTALPAAPASDAVAQPATIGQPATIAQPGAVAQPHPAPGPSAVLTPADDAATHTRPAA